MISAKGLTEAEVRKLVRRDLNELAPRFRDAVKAAIEECNREGLDAMVYEAVRSDAVQQAYYALGRTVRPPLYTVTNAFNALGSWHYYGLAVDVISKTVGWKYSMSWIRRVATIFKKHGCDWGGDWQKKDLPHFQWGGCRASPSARARELVRIGGREAVWREVGAGVPAIRPTSILQRGDRGTAVAALQRKLGITADGIFGPGTENSVRVFQKSAGLQVDGVVGATTKAALDRR